MRFAAGSIRIEPLGSVHDRTGFSCGKDPLDRYIRQQASQDVRRGVASVFVAARPEEAGRILGFFSLSAASIVPTDLPLSSGALPWTAVSRGAGSARFYWPMLPRKR